MKKAIACFCLVVCMLIIFASCSQSQCDHDWVLIDDTASCESSGVKTYECQKCGKTEEAYSNKKGHDYSILVNQIDSTCTSAGTATYKCSRCEDSTTETIGKKNHRYSNYKCTVCGAIHPDYPHIEVPETPISLYEKKYDGSIQDRFTIQDIRIDTRVYTSGARNGKYADSVLVFTVDKTYDTKGGSYSSSCVFGYKIYNSDNVVIESGNVYTSAICVGETTIEKQTIYSLEGGNEYRVEILCID